MVEEGEGPAQQVVRGVRMRGKRKTATMTYFQKASRTFLWDDDLTLALMLDIHHNPTMDSTVELELEREHVCVGGGEEAREILPSSLGNGKLKTR